MCSCLLCRIPADILQAAAFTFGFAGIADGPAVHDEPMAQVAALFGRDDLPQCHFHLLRFFDAVHQTDLIAQADAVGVRYDGRLAEHIAHDKVRALPAHAGQRQQLFKGGGHLAVVPVTQHPHTGRDIPRLAAAQPARLDDGFDVLRFGSGQRRHIGVLCKQVLHDDVHPRVGALCSQPHADQQLPGVVVVQCAACVWVFLFQSVNDRARQRLFGGKIFRRGSFAHEIASFHIRIA